MSEEVAAPAPARAMSVRNVIHAGQLKTDIGINPVDLNAAFMDQASLLVHYGTLAAQASRQVDDMKMLLEAAESTVYRKERDAAATAGTKVTEKMLEMAVAVHPKIVQIKRALNEAKQIESIAKVAVEGFKHRRDMLVGLGASEREERKGELRIMSAESRERVIEETKQRVMERMRASTAAGE
jgi:hypothetical protein